VIGKWEWWACELNLLSPFWSDLFACLRHIRIPGPPFLGNLVLGRYLRWPRSYKFSRNNSVFLLLRGVRILILIIDSPFLVSPPSQYLENIGAILQHSIGKFWRKTILRVELIAIIIWRNLFCLWDFWFQSTIRQIILSEDPVWKWDRSAAQDIDWRREKFNIP
jgi:hypothetical protein